MGSRPTECTLYILAESHVAFSPALGGGGRAVFVNMLERNGDRFFFFSSLILCLSITLFFRVFLCFFSLAAGFLERTVLSKAELHFNEVRHRPCGGAAHPSSSSSSRFSL